MSALELRSKVRRQARATGAGKLGRCILGEMPALRRDCGSPGRLNYQRLREVEKVMRRRHGEILPDARGTEDLQSIKDYFRAALLSGAPVDLRGMCARFAPWALAEAFLTDLEGERAAWRRRSKKEHTMLPADAVAKLLRVTAAERRALKLQTIGACDQSRAKRDDEARERKRRQDRDRQAAKRKATGARPRAESVEQTKPWEAEGISRRTWFRRRGTETSRVTIVDSLAGDASVPTDGDGAAASARSSLASSHKAETPTVSRDHDVMQNIATAKREAQGAGTTSLPVVQEAEPHGARERQQPQRWAGNAYAIARGLVDA